MDLVLGKYLDGELPYASGAAPKKKKKRVGQYLKLGSKYMDVDWKKMHNLNGENYVLGGQKCFKPRGLLSESSEEHFRAKRGASMYRSITTKTRSLEDQKITVN